MNDFDIDALLNEGDESDFDVNMVRKCCTDLLKRFDTVQVFCSKYKLGENYTVNLDWGSGNWFARRGQIRDWMLRKDQDEKNNCREGMDLD